ncbi:MAG: hypothetical protein MK324_03220 [Pirellulales bacterium]|nr:hypothetical protein [Pirellulales bacterium]
MSKAQIKRRVALFGLAANAIGLPIAINAANRTDSDSPVTKQDFVDFFEAKKRGDIDVMFIPRNSKSANVIVRNKTKNGLKVRLPEAFAGVPMLGQMGGGMGMGGFQNIEPGKVRKFKVMTVCLEHGKKEPNPRVKYDIVPIESFTKKAEVIELCRMLGTGQMNQSAAQAAAWHFTDGLSWPELVHKIGARHLNGTVDRYFHPNQVRLGMQYAKVASHRAILRPCQVDKIESLSNQ